MRRSPWTTFCASALTMVAFGCGGTEQEKKEIIREQVADSAFKPSSLENTIEGLIAELTDAESEDFKISVITKPFGGYWEPVKVGANRAMGELDLQGQVEAPTDEDDPDITTERQAEIVKSRREDGYGGIGLAPMRDVLEEEVARLVKGGVPVVTFDTDIADSKRQLYIGTNNSEAGKTAGQTLAKLLAKKTEGTIIILGYDDTDWSDGYARSMGAKEALEDAGFTVKVHRVGWTETEVENDMEVLPQMAKDADPPLAGMLGMFSNAYRCAQIVEGLGYEPGEIKIAAFDFEPDTIDYMDKGYIQATHVQRQYYMGYLVPYAIYSLRVLGVEKTIDVLGDQMIDEERFDTGVDVIQDDQVDEYNDFLDTLGISG